jgi:hypothetical protein
MTQHRWANADRDLRFNDLFNLIIDPAVLLLTWQRARRTRGALMLLQVPPNQARPGGTAEIRDLTSYPHNFEWLVSVVSCWATLDGPTGEQLLPGLPDTIAVLHRHGELDISYATARVGVLDVGGENRPAEWPRTAGSSRAVVIPSPEQPVMRHPTREYQSDRESPTDTQRRSHRRPVAPVLGGAAPCARRRSLDTCWS